MSRLKVLILLTIFAFLWPGVVNSLYEDQVGKFDWRLSYVGKLKFAEFDSAKRVIIGSEENVVASLQLKNGQISWRQVMEDPAQHQIELLHVSKEVVTVSGNGQVYYVRGWDLNAGFLTFEWTIQPEKQINAYWTVHNNELYHIVPVLGSHLEVTSYKLQTGENKGVTQKISTPWLTDLSRCTLTNTVVACISAEDSTGILQYLDVTSNKIFKFQIQNLIGAASGQVKLSPIKYPTPAILLTRNAVSRLILLTEEIPKTLPYSLNNNVISVQSGDQNLLIESKILTEKSNKHFQIRTVNQDTASDETVESEWQENIESITPIIGICRGTACRLLLVTDHDTIILLQLPNGQSQWFREESMANVVDVEFIELPISDSDLSIEKEFTLESSDIITMFVKRIASQVHQLSSMLSGQQSSTSREGMVRDEFGLQKLIIGATKNGKIFAMDPRTGNFVWKKFLKNIAPFKSLGQMRMMFKEQRSTRYSPLNGVVTLIAKDAVTGKGILYTFDPMTGESEKGVERLSYNIKQVMLLYQEDREHLKALIIQADDDKLHVYPEESKTLVSEHAKQTFMYNADVKKGVLTGYSFGLASGEFKASPVWQFSYYPSELVDISMRPAHEKVHSQGRVLSDRSVLYKYVNPNMIAIATLTNDTLHKHVLSVYLIDGITGFVVYSASHKRATGPVHILHSENWLVYTYFSERFRRIELASVELYEGAIQSNSTAFSSHAVSSIPHVESQAYILPASPLALATTLTERGITSKHLLLGLSSGGIVEVPWAIVEPRGTQTAGGGPEEGYIPYMPEIGLPPEATINYYRSVERIKGIEVSAARLESTSLVFVHGLDHFYTRVSPSKQFDVLKEDFDHWLIIMVLVGLTLASYVTKQLASRKALKQAWK